MEAQKSLKEDVGLWLLAGAAIIVVFTYYGWRYSFKGSRGSEPWIFDGVNQQQIRQLTLVENNDVRWRLKNKNQSWTLTKPSDVNLDSSSAARLVKTLINLEPTFRFSGRKGETYGTNSGGPYLEVKSGGTVHTFYLGGKQPSGSGRYLVYGRKNPTVFVIKKQDFNALNQSLFDLRRKSLFNVSSNSVRRVTLSADDSRTTYKRSADGWTVNGRTINDTAAQSFTDDLRTFLFLSANRFYDTMSSVPGSPRGEVTVRTTSDSVTVVMGPGRDGKRLLKRGKWPVVAVREDPAQIFSDVPERPDNWPEPLKPASSSGSPNMPVSGRKSMPNLGQIGRQ